jgi:two-component system KDP operon response regulator KdpE
MMGAGKILIIHRQKSDCSALKSILSRERYDVIEASLDMGRLPFGIDDCCLLLLDTVAAARSAHGLPPAAFSDWSSAFSLGSANAWSRRFVRRKPRQVKRKECPSLKAIKIGDKTVILSSRVVRGSLGDIRLTRFEYSILNQLRTHANQTVRSVEIVRKLWPSDPTKGVHSLRAFIKNLRKKIEPDPAQPQYIITDLAVGYRLQLSAEGRGR